MPFRRERASTKQARKGIMSILRQLAVFSKACVQTWMGEYFFLLCVLLLTLAQAWLRSRVYSRSSDNYSGVVSNLE